MTWKSYELPEPVELKAGEWYAMGFNGGVPFVRPASEHEISEVRTVGSLGVRVHDPSWPQLVCPSRPMTAKWIGRDEIQPGATLSEQPFFPGTQVFTWPPS